MKFNNLIAWVLILGLSYNVNAGADGGDGSGGGGGGSDGGSWSVSNTVQFHSDEITQIILSSGLVINMDDFNCLKYAPVVKGLMVNEAEIIILNSPQLRRFFIDQKEDNIEVSDFLAMLDKTPLKCIPAKLHKETMPTFKCSIK